MRITPRALGQSIIYEDKVFDFHCIFPLLCKEGSRTDEVKKFLGDPSFPVFFCSVLEGLDFAGRGRRAEGWAS